MPIKSKAAYWEDVERLVHEIGELTKQPAKLYRIINGTWQLLSADTKEFFDPYTYGLPNYSRFAVAYDNPGSIHAYDKTITSFWLFPFPGSCAICVSSGSMVFSPFQSKGVNKLGIRLREALAGACGYSVLMCTDILLHERSIRTIEGAGFKSLFEVNNRRTNRTIRAYMKELA